MTASADTTPSPSATFSSLHKITFVDIILWGLRIAMLAVVVGGTIGTLIKGTYSTAQWLDFFLFGLTIGGVYALIALGYTMVYGILRLINFAHGDITMTGAFSAFFLARSLHRAGILDSYPILSMTAIMLLSMPISAAASRSSETARIAIPILVFWTMT